MTAALWLNLNKCRTTIKDATRKFENLKSMRNWCDNLLEQKMLSTRRKEGSSTS